MANSDSSINPKPIVSLMFGVSVGFWANTLVRFITTGGAAAAKTASVESGDVTAHAFRFSNVVDDVALISGTLFLLDLLCIVWWYARYIYRIQAVASFGSYFLDFVIASMFALAANSWTDPETFLVASMSGSIFLLVRFVLLYRSADASLTDRHIMLTTGIMLVAALLIAGLGIAVLKDAIPELKPALGWGGHLLPGIVSLAGVVLTIVMRGKIDVAVDIYAARTSPIGASPLVWPRNPTLQREQITRIRQRTKAGLSDFCSLFEKYGRYDRLCSRVHSETDLLMQSYILAVPSSDETDHEIEIEKKAFMVAASHWLDDLIDGRSEVSALGRIRSGPPLSDEEDEAVALFTHIYKPLIIKHTSKAFYAEFYNELLHACPFPFNRKYLLLGLNRVAYGAVVFSPKISADDRMRILDKHNVFLKDWNDERTSDFARAVEDLLDQIAQSWEAGRILLGLTTKTVQEVAMSSEGRELNIGLSILYSILYAPLIYYHNIGSELAEGEMVSLQSFDTDYDLWIPWIERALQIIRQFGDGDRTTTRLQQIEMTYLCFEELLPRRVGAELKGIFVPDRDDPIVINRPVSAGAVLTPSSSLRDRMTGATPPPG